MSSRFNRKGSSRRSTLTTGRSLRGDNVTRLLSNFLSNELWVPTNLPLDTIFHSSVELQHASCNLVFYDRVLGEVIEYPFPAHRSYQPIQASSLSQYFDTRRLGLECFCGLIEDEPQYLKIKIRHGKHLMSCVDCGLYLVLDKIRETADFWGVYPFMDKIEGTQPATVSAVALFEPSILRVPVRRSQRNVPDRVSAYNTHNLSRHTADLRFGKSSNSAVEELLEMFDWHADEENERGKASGSSPVPVNGLLKEFRVSKGKGKSKTEDDTLNCFASHLRNKNHKEPSSSTHPIASSSKILEIKFCRFCDLGMVEDSIEEHETECWADQHTATGSAEPAEATDET